MDAIRLAEYVFKRIRDTEEQITEQLAAGAIKKHGRIQISFRQINSASCLRRRY